jgi:hypothetical protein
MDKPVNLNGFSDPITSAAVRRWQPVETGEGPITIALVFIDFRPVSAEVTSSR